MKSIAKLILITSLRDKLFLSIFLMLFFGSLIAKFIGFSALYEKEAMSTALIAGINRIAINLGLIMFISFSVRRSFDNREIEFFLAKPISRNKFIISHFLSYSILSIILNILSLIFLILFSHAKIINIIFFSYSLLLENLIMVAFCCLASFILASSTSSVCLSLAFYCFARLAGFFTANIDLSKTSSIAEQALVATSIFMPRLDLFANGSILIYGKMDNALAITLFGLIYPIFLIIIALIDFRKKEF